MIVVSLVADERVGAGFQVREFLPKPARREDLLGALERAGVPPGDSPRVLVVGDDPSALKVAERSLQSCAPIGGSAPE